ncbi:MAG: type II toxin-antitoxin system prevent-host-death family antitoxin [Clostridia bacterium]|nr:type II toxin-antitoxin system prevent-host-death family antitoxin [Clostridia bacterium]
MPRCIPIRDLKDTSAISQLCKEAKEPVFITKNGYNDVVIMSSEMYERMRIYSIYEKLMEAEADVAAGRVSDAFASIKKLEEKYGI